MKQQQLKKLYYQLRHHILTGNNLVLVIALLIAVSWAWGSIGVLERNYRLQREIYAKERELDLVELETETLRYQRNYYKSDEYKELAARQSGLALPGEKVLILPANSKRSMERDDKQASSAPRQVVAQSNLEQWVNFLFGGNARSGPDLQS